MSSSDPKKDDAQKPRQRQGGTRPPSKQSKAQPATAKRTRPPAKGSPKSATGRAKQTAAETRRAIPPPVPSFPIPSTVDPTQLPTHRREDPGGGRPRQRRRWHERPSTVCFLIGGALFFIFGVINGHSSSSHTPSPTGVVTPAPTPSPTPTTETTPTTPTASQHKGPSVAWGPHEITVERNTSFSLDTPGLKNEPTGFEIGFVSEHGSNNFTTVGGVGKVALWTGARQPYYKDCASILPSTNTEYVTLETSGQWLCAETGTHLVVRLRYDSNSGERFSFLATVYNPAT